MTEHSTMHDWRDIVTPPKRKRVTYNVHVAFERKVLSIMKRRSARMQSYFSGSMLGSGEWSYTYELLGGKCHYGDHEPTAIEGMRLLRFVLYELKATQPPLGRNEVDIPDYATLLSEAKVDAARKSKQAELLEAIIQRDDERAHAIVRDGVDPNYIDRANTPLHRAVTNKNERLVKELLQCGADPNIKVWAAYERGTTPLISAIEYGTPEIVRILLDHGADPALASQYGDPMAIAERTRNTVAVELLRPLLERGAKE